MSNSQSKENSTVDARTFQEIWEFCNYYEKQDLRRDIIASIGCSRQTIENWSNGIRPANPEHRKTVSRIVSRYLNIKTIPQTLFPTR